MVLDQYSRQGTRPPLAVLSQARVGPCALRPFPCTSLPSLQPRPCPLIPPLTIRLQACSRSTCMTGTARGCWRTTTWRRCCTISTASRRPPAIMPNSKPCSPLHLLCGACCVCPVCCGQRAASVWLLLRGSAYAVHVAIDQSPPHVWCVCIRS